jgi:ABC-2 type transport system ATP-binding protein
MTSPSAGRATTPNTADAVIVAEGVVKRWGTTTALSGASLVVDPGVTGLLGANGAGKTTFMGMVLGLHRPDAGRLQVLGLDPSVAGPEVRARLGYAPEHHNLPPDISANDLVRHIAEVHGLPHREATSRASDALWMVGLGEERFRPVGTMSTGQRQRVKLAQAIAHDPHLVLLDEPTDGLDPVQRDDMLALIRRIGTEFGINVLLSSHLLEEVERVCDAAVILADGAVRASGRLDELTGGDHGLTVVVDERPDELAARLTGHGVGVAVHGNTLSLTDDAGELDLALLVRDALAATGIGVRRLQRRTLSLEDVFLGVDA